MTFHTPPQNQGQIVEVSYAMADGQVIRRIYDRSDRSTDYAVSKAHLDDEGDYWNREPSNVRWRKVDEAVVEALSKNPHAVALGKLGRAAKTEAQAEASRENGKRGGRPRKKP